uniref:Magnesium chelatase family protein n=1 Tax=Candidatus Kentrum eta TaxID=2126337 RepID=A0A450UPE4_9GAMM|nr:MAG: magnesium chelatase family protein [Candidatus Kentron sp. H]VFJ94413.1 MAG: magnesium chelatase family protein [Candidatus Kentron sp. H]VFK01064.1 MAG: magnesium chelatase family protein [Candidatus Kentron sp. H]
MSPQATMSLAVVYSRAQLGLQAPLVTVEVHITGGQPYLSMVGLPETAVKESKDRVRSAIMNTRHEFPYRRVTINLAPADLPKEGGRFDLPIALGILAASGQIPARALEGKEFLGELALTGALRPVRGVLPAALNARAGKRDLIVPRENADEASLVEGARVIPADNLLAVCAHLTGSNPLPMQLGARKHDVRETGVDIADVRGQYQAKRALEIASAGAHNLLFLGPPGAGKTMLASRLPGILPPMTELEALESATVRSVATAGFSPGSWGQRPFRAPHHTASGVALVGGGSQPRPGEISLAHHGVLFLDEFPEFDRRVLEVLREPMESGRIVISRAAHQAEFPARFQLVAAMNPCPCGYLGDGTDRCHCSADQVHRYRGRISGPLLDRIDLHVEVPPVKWAQLRPPSQGGNQPDGETSAQVQARVEHARERQLAGSGKPNAWLDSREVEKYCRLDEANTRLLEMAIERLGLSARAGHRVLKVARTIADLVDSDEILAAHITEAMTYRGLDRGDFS